MMIVRSTSDEGYEKYEKGGWVPSSKEEINSVLFAIKETYEDAKGIERTCLRSSDVVYFNPDPVELTNTLRRLEIE